MARLARFIPTLRLILFLALLGGGLASIRLALRPLSLEFHPKHSYWDALFLFGGVAVLGAAPGVLTKRPVWYALIGMIAAVLVVAMLPVVAEGLWRGIIDLRR